MCFLRNEPCSVRAWRSKPVCVASIGLLSESVEREGPSQKRSRPEGPASRDQPSSNYVIDLVCRTEPPFGQGEQVCLIDAHARSAEDPSVVFVVILFGHWRKLTL